MHELHSHNVNGKGDKERSPGWRNNYDQIENFQKNGIPGLVQLAPGRYRKSYGSPVSVNPVNLEPVKAVAAENFDTGNIDTYSVPGLPSVPQDQGGDACGGSPRCCGLH